MRSIYCSAILALTALASTAQAACPAEGFTAMKDFNYRSYFQGTWYSLKQVPTPYQPSNDCVTASYKLEEVNGELVLKTFNGATVGGLTGSRVVAQLNGTIPDLSKPSEATVGPRGGPYWIIDAGTYSNTKPSCGSADEYEWAIVSGGPPVAQSTNGCLPGVGPTNMKGFWLLSRLPVVKPEDLDKLTAVASSKGFDVSALTTVPQQGCKYDA